jgi:hypothetical protein
MDITNTWVHFEDTLDLEIFMTLCEENDICWEGLDEEPRRFLQSELERYAMLKGKGHHHIVCGYATDGIRLFDVYAEIIFGQSTTLESAISKNFNEDISRFKVY